MRVAICACSGRAALHARTATKHAAIDCLIPPRCHVIAGRRQADRACIYFRASLKLRAVTKRHIRPMEIFSIGKGVARSCVDKWREVSPAMLDMIGPVPSGVPRAEALFRIPGWSAKMHG